MYPVIILIFCAFISTTALLLPRVWRGDFRAGPPLRAKMEPGEPETDLKASEDIQINVRLLNGIEEVSRESWNSLVEDSHPFLLYDWINALEASGCASAREGWQPLHIVVEQLIKDNNETSLVAAMPMYAKSHSYGEFIFDQAWADFAQRVLGIRYYPKLLAAVPFTPATGSRLMLSSSLTANQADGIATAVTAFMKNLMESNGLSGAHANFLPEKEVGLFVRQNYVLRQTVQYRWMNKRLTVQGNEQKFADIKNGRGEVDAAETGTYGEGMFSDFEDYLTCFKSKRRTQIKRERKSVYEEQGILMEVIRGDDPRASADFYQKMYEIYTTTIDKMWGQRYLSSDFFKWLYEAPNDFKKRIVFIVAYDPNRPDYSPRAKGAPKSVMDFVDVLLDKNEKKEDVPAKEMGKGVEKGSGDPYVVENIIAGTINLVSDTHFYGRYWGALEYRKHLHFETCYYKSIEFCVENGLQVLEPGAGGGEFKFLRGFNPFLVNSVHTFSSPVLQKAVSDFLQEERDYNEELKDFLLEKSSVAGGAGAK